MNETKTYYVVRQGWNAANQSSIGTVRNPKNNFESNLYQLVDIVEAESEADAISQCGATVYNNQFLFATANPRSVKGLTDAVREFCRAESMRAEMESAGEDDPETALQLEYEYGLQFETEE